MAASQTIYVSHLGGIEAGYKLSGDRYDASKPTCVLINSMCMTVSLYRPQFECKELTDTLNLLAIEPLGHGATSCASEHFTYWDTAIMALQVLDALKINHFFALGTSQGGWIVARMALLAPERVSLCENSEYSPALQYCEAGPPLPLVSCALTHLLSIDPRPNASRNFYGLRIFGLAIERLLGSSSACWSIS
jgi:pimeloyl-ACP methyl ester carboxylesterase